MGRKKLLGSDIGKTSVSFQRSELEDYKKHAKDEGFSFSRLVKLFFMEDMENKATATNPEKKLARLQLRKERLQKLDGKAYGKTK